MKNLRKMAIGALLTCFLVQPVYGQPSNSELHKVQDDNDIVDFNYFGSPPKSAQQDPLTVIREGKPISITTVLNKPDWQRPVYRTYWNPTYAGGRWSSLRIQIHYALHRVFASYTTAGIYYDFVHDVGIWDELHTVSFPTSEKAFDKVMFVVMQADVKKTYTRGNQIVIVATPKRTGLHVFTINTADVPSTDPRIRKDRNLIQLVTEDGHEIDYWIV